MNDLNLIRCDSDELWDEFVKRSPQCNIFCKTTFLNSLDVDYDLLWVMERNVPCLGAILIKGDDKRPILAPFPFSMYQGVLFDRKYHQMQVHQRVNESLCLLDYLLMELEKRYSRVSFCLHPHIEDIRAFSWFNYHEPEQSKFKIGVKYTGIIDLSDENNFDSYLKKIRKSRRYEYRKAQKAGLIVEKSADIDLLVNLYQLTFERQNIKVSQNVIVLIRNISESALANHFGELSVCLNKQGEALSASLFLHDKFSSYYLIGANNPNFRQTGSGIFLVLENIRDYQSRGCNYVDVCGLNSPNRGDFKSSLNAKPVPYYIAMWEKKGQSKSA